MLRLAAAALLTLSLASPAPAADKLSRYKRAVDECAGRQVAALDDGISSAEIVGSVLLQRCNGEHYALYSRVIAGKSSGWIAGYMEQVRIQFASYVLLHRAQRRGEG